MRYGCGAGAGAGAGSTTAATGSRTASLAAVAPTGPLPMALIRAPPVPAPAEAPAGARPTGRAARGAGGGETHGPGGAVAADRQRLGLARGGHVVGLEVVVGVPVGVLAVVVVVGVAPVPAVVVGVVGLRGVVPAVPTRVVVLDESQVDTHPPHGSSHRTSPSTGVPQRPARAAGVKTLPWLAGPLMPV